VRGLNFSTPTPLLCLKNWLLITQNLSTPAPVWLLSHVMCSVNNHWHFKSTVLKITPAPVPRKNIHSWSCSGSYWKTLTPAGVDTCTPAPAHLCSRAQRTRLQNTKCFCVFFKGREQRFSQQVVINKCFSYTQKIFRCRFVLPFRKT